MAAAGAGQGGAAAVAGPADERDLRVGEGLRGELPQSGVNRGPPPAVAAVAAPSAARAVPPPNVPVAAAAATATAPPSSPRLLMSALFPMVTMSPIRLSWM